MKTKPAISTEKSSRRFFLKKAGLTALGSALALTTYAWRIEPHWISVVERQLPIQHLPLTLVGKRLIQISDLHIGAIVDDDYLLGAFELVARLEPDLLLITGDFMTCHGLEQIDHACGVLQILPHGKIATVGILGNHDYGAGWQQDQVADRLSECLGNLGIIILRNEIRDFAGLQIGGADEYWSSNFDLPKTLTHLNPDQASLMMCHNPDGCDHSSWGNYEGWILAGHTHGGQCKMPFLAPPFLPVNNKRYTQGEFDLGQGRRLYINPGLGYLRRVRFCVRPEITVFRLEEGSGEWRLE